MPRPTLLIAEPESVQALSVRKLVLETAKFNVLTAHSTHEAIDIFHLFPNISCTVLVSGDDIDCEKIAETIKSAARQMPVIVLLPNVAGVSAVADHTLSSHEPENLLALARSLLGDPRNLGSGE